MKIPEPLSTKKLRKKLREWFNLFIRLRDIDKGCISCGRRYSRICGAWQAGHFYNSASCHASFDFDESNVNGQCAGCNLNEGNKQGYRKGLVKRFGEGILDLLEIKKAASRRAHWGIFEYQAMIKLYKEKVEAYKHNSSSDNDLKFDFNFGE